MLVNCHSNFTEVDATCFHLELCYASQPLPHMHVIRKFTAKLIKNHYFFLVLTEQISLRKHLHNTLIGTFGHWEITGIHHLSLVTIRQLMDLRQKFLTMKLESGDNTPTTPFLMAIGTLTVE